MTGRIARVEGRDKKNDYMRGYMRDRYHERRALGLCRWCPALATAGPRGSTEYCDECRAKRKANNLGNSRKCSQDYRLRLRVAALEMYGNRCEQCGCDERDRLNLHHKNGDGAADRACSTGTSGGARKVHQRLHKEGFDPSLALLCAKCHAAQHPRKRSA